MVKKVYSERTPVVKYWNLLKDPFKDKALSGTRLSLFVARGKEIADLLDGIDNSLLGVFGSLGIGKTSFLYKSYDVLKADGNCNVIYIDLGDCMGQNIYSALLKELLTAVKNKNIKIKKGTISVNLELERIESKIIHNSTISGGANTVIKAEVTDGRTTEVPQHTEESSKLLVRTLLEAVDSRLVILIDDIERIKYVMADQASYLKTVSAFTMTFKELSNELVSIVVSLDDHFADLVDNERSIGNGAFSFSFGELIELQNFKPIEIKNIIQIRLTDAGWKKQIQDFIGADTFLLLCAATGGHPRKVFKVLRESMRYISRNDKTTKIDNNILLYGLKQAKYFLDETDISIVVYLKENGAVSPSDKNFQNIIGLGRTALADRLKSLQTLIGLEVTKADQISGRQEYSLPDLDRS
jgi:hypothetical protein